MTYDEMNAELQQEFLKQFNLFHHFDQWASEEEKHSADYLEIKNKFQKINLQYQDFLTMFKETNAKGNDEYGLPGARCEV